MTVTYAPAKFEVATCNELGGDAFTSTLFNLDIGVKITQNVAQYPPHHMAFAPAKFEFATSSCLGGYVFTKNALFDLDESYIM